jgi:hypothetical protein
MNTATGIALILVATLSLACVLGGGWGAAVALNGAATSLLMCCGRGEDEG